MAYTVLNFPLSTGKSIPAIGLGLGGINRSQVVEAVLQAIKVGYRHFDTAIIYGTEAALGEALAEAFRSGLVRREEVFITSKLWSSEHEPEDVLSSVKNSLSLLQLDYIDLYLIHWPLKLKKGVELQVKDDDYLPLDIKVERHPVWQQKKLKPFCDAKGILVSGWSPLGSPGSFYGTRDVITNPIVESIAKKHGKTPAQVALRWGVQTGAIVLPRSFNPKRVAENFEIFSWELSEDDINEISRIEQRRIGLADMFCNPTSGPYKTVQELWDGDL
ncbi:hypothetical protein O6H91_19G067300 [Diphasiastrum complanatum]|uniref:Uncharacterized protein n=1 Tax=Diphasiastrum complanatum TaxID=34168 RepID=A0ACC2AW74_DIPCM|nr:hypothetical protein O6H91_19G067300 [Diphasiastrum complanatum]